MRLRPKVSIRLLLPLEEGGRMGRAAEIRLRDDPRRGWVAELRAASDAPGLPRRSFAGAGALDVLGKMLVWVWRRYPGATVVPRERQGAGARGPPGAAEHPQPRSPAPPAAPDRTAILTIEEESNGRRPEAEASRQRKGPRWRRDPPSGG